MIGLARGQSLHAGRVYQRALKGAFLRTQHPWNALKNHSTRTFHFKKTWWWPTKCVVAGEGRIGWSKQGSTLAPKSHRNSNSLIISSLDPTNFKTKNQEVTDISGFETCFTTVHGYEDAPQHRALQLSYSHFFGEKRLRFPTGARGVLYFRHVEGDSVESQLRFRLCRDLEDFSNGSDLLLPDGRTWSRSLQFMARKRRSYAPLLALLSEEFPVLSVQVDPIHDSRRIITTLRPADLFSKGQTVSNISGMQAVCCTPASSQGENVNFYYNQVMGKPNRPFPPDTVGLLYYKQSLTRPTEVGELRFRLCSDPSLFDQGRDLTLPSGDPWFYSSLSLRKSSTLRPLANMLYQDGLLKPLDSSHRREHMTKYSPVPVTNLLLQPFVIDLSHQYNHLPLENSSLPLEPLRVCLWNQKLRRQIPYRGRLLVQFEKSPTGIRPSIPHNSDPVVALRILELLTPVVPVGAIECIKRPEPGMLHWVLNRGKFVQWTYAPKGHIRAHFADPVNLSAASESER